MVYNVSSIRSYYRNWFLLHRVTSLLIELCDSQKSLPVTYSVALLNGSRRDLAGPFISFLIYTAHADATAVKSLDICQR